MTTTATKTCDACHGTGRPAARSERQRRPDCPRCSGTGRIEEAIPSTENEGWGFWGTWQTASQDRDLPITVDEAWTRAIETYMDRIPNSTPQDAREWLDSRYGRHYADAVIDGIVTGTPTEEAFQVDWLRPGSHIWRTYHARTR